MGMTQKTLINRIWLRWRSVPGASAKLAAMMMWVIGLPRYKSTGRAVVKSRTVE